MEHVWPVCGRDYFDVVVLGETIQLVEQLEHCSVHFSGLALARTSLGTDGIKLVNEEPSFVHTACRITVDLRQSKTSAMLQSTSFPETPEPPCTIADILQLKQMQRFDLMAIPTEIIAERMTLSSMSLVRPASELRSSANCGASACSVAAPAVTIALAINATQVVLGEIVRESAERGPRANDKACGFE